MRHYLLALASFYLIHSPVLAAPRTVYLASADFPMDRWLMLCAAIAATGDTGPLLRESPLTTPGIQRFLGEYRPERILRFTRDDEPLTIWRRLGLSTDRLLIASSKSRSLAIQASILAGLERVPLWLADESSPESRKYGESLVARAAETTLLRDADHVAQRILDRLKQTGIDTAIIAHPNDDHALLSPWLAHLYDAPVLLIDRDLHQRLRRLPDALRRVDSLILLGSNAFLPTEHRPNPLEGKDAFIEMEPLTPEGDAPFSYAIGRLFDPDPAGVLLTLARQRLPQPEQPRALIASNPGGSLELLEMCSRHTTTELRARGLNTLELFRDDLTARTLRRSLPDQDWIIWEGHHNTLMNDWGFPHWNEPLRPGLVMLQSCLALTDEKVRPLFRRGSVAIVSTASRTYSASGGAFTLAYVDALVHDRLTAGAALRQSKNFLLAYGKLKEQRLASGAKLVGANRRSAWAFTLWGDPNWRPALPPQPEDAPARVEWQTSRIGEREYRLEVTIPQDRGDVVSVGPYRSQLALNMRVAGLLTGPDEERRPVPMVFAERELLDVPDDAEPRLTSQLPNRHWTTLWDARRKVLTILAIPRPNDTALRFRVTWDR